MLLESLIEKMNHKLGTSYKLSLATDYNFANWLWDEHGHVAQSIVNSRGFFAELKAYPGSLEALRKIVDDGHDMLIVTSYSWSSDFSADEKIGWYKKNAPFVPVKNIQLGHQKHRTLCDLAVDDGPDKMKKLRKKQPHAKIGTIWWPYHRGIENRWDFIAHDYLRPAQAWSQLLLWIDRVAEMAE